MTNDEIDMAISAHCGWEHLGTKIRDGIEYHFGRISGYAGGMMLSPGDYCASMDSTQNALRYLDDEQKIKLIRTIADVDGHPVGLHKMEPDKACVRLLLSQPRDLAIAYVKTIGRWKE